MGLGTKLHVHVHVLMDQSVFPSMHEVQVACISALQAFSTYFVFDWEWDSLKTLMWPQAPPKPHPSALERWSFVNLFLCKDITVYLYWKTWRIVINIWWNMIFLFLPFHFQLTPWNVDTLSHDGFEKTVCFCFPVCTCYGASYHASSKKSAPQIIQHPFDYIKLLKFW